MSTIVHDVVQGSDEWLAVRAPLDCASDAPVMMGYSPKCTRSELVRMKATGDEREFSQWVRDNLLARGHEVEVYGRARIEEELGEPLYQATMSKGTLLASYDGINMAGTLSVEVKLWNEELAAAVREGIVPPLHWPQLEQQLEVSDDLERVIFVVTDGTPERFVKCDYFRVPGRIEKIKAGWTQFHEDVANYVHVEVIPKAAPTLHAGLPTAFISVRGEVALESNLDKCREALTLYVKSIPEKPETDEDFANCEQAVKDLQEAQTRLEESRAAALSRFDSVEAMNRLVDEMVALARDTRLRTERLVKARKEQIRDEIRRGGINAFALHITKLNTRLGFPYMPPIQANFAEVMKGKKTVSSLRDAVNTEVARVKIEASEVADRIETNLKMMQPYELLPIFPDSLQIVLKAPDDFRALVLLRVADYRAKKEREEAETRERIRLEEEAKARAKVEAEQAAARAAMPANEPLAAPAREVTSLVPRRSGEDFVPHRPLDSEIVAVLANHYRVPAARVVGWLLEFDAQAVATAAAGD